MSEVPSSLDSNATTARLSGALDAVEQTISYLRATTQKVPTVSGPNLPGDGQYVACDELIDNPDWLRSVIDHTGHQLGTSDPMVAASLFVQSYSYRVLTLAVACATISGIVPESSAQSMAIALKGGRVSLVAYTHPEILVIDETDQPLSMSLVSEGQLESMFDFIHARAIDAHLAKLIDATRSTTRIGERLLWGNVAASLAVAFRTMEGSLGPWVEEVGTYFVDHAPTRLRGLGSFLTLENDGRRGWFWERTNCCLYDRLPGGVRCSDCSRTPIKIRREAYRISLEGS